MDRRAATTGCDLISIASSLPFLTRAWKPKARPRIEEIEIDVMVRAAQIYALMALDICGREQPLEE
jgi:hypothetical protein